MRRSLLALVLVACAPPSGVSAPVSPAVPEVTARAAPEPLPARGRPPAIRGGGLLVTADGRRALVTDPDRDAVVVVDLTGGAMERVAHVVFDRGSAPSRMTEDSDGRVHVVLRGAGAVAAIDPEDGSRARPVTVCPSPRGVAWDAAEGHLLVACSGGEVKAVTPRQTRTIARLGPDLRDVTLDRDGRAFVTRFRSAEVISLRDGHVHAAPSIAAPRPSLYPRALPELVPFAAHVAWRTIPSQDGGLWMLHQRHMASEVRAPFIEYYGNQANPRVVKPALAYVEDGVVRRSLLLEGGPLAVDVAEAPDGSVAIAYGAGAIVEVIDPSLPGHAEGGEPSAWRHRIRVPLAGGRAVGVAWAGDLLLVQQRDPSGLWLVEPEHGSLIAMIAFGEAAEPDAGVALFHEQTSTEVACASCHPEGGDDGHVWNFAGTRRRTPSLRGGVMATAPFHWDGEHTDLGGLMLSVFQQRMGGRAVDDEQLGQLGDWLDQVPVPRFTAPEVGDPARGRALFVRDDVGCARCHSGPHLTDNMSHDVGTGGFFQTPTLLGLRDRAPYFHDGRAETIRARFTTEHTDRHGSIDGLEEGDINNLIAYLETL